MLRLLDAKITDNEDPKKLGRVKFKAEQLVGGKEHPSWAEPAFPALGTGWGIFFVPEKGQDVKIFYDEDNPEHPVYHASGYKSTDKIPTEALGDYPFKAIIKWYELGYLLFDRKAKEITLLNYTGNIVITAVVGEIGMSSPVNIREISPLLELGLSDFQPLCNLYHALTTFNTHVHTGVTSGDSTTGPPIPQAVEGLDTTTNLTAS